MTHMDLKKSTYEGLSMIYETRRFFSLKIISSYIGCGINIRRGKNSLKTDISLGYLEFTKMVTDKGYIVTTQQCNVTKPYFFKLQLRPKYENYRITSMVTEK